MAKRLSKTTFDWKALAERVHPDQKGQYSAFKAKSDSYLQKMMANPESPPNIDWEKYKSAVPVQGMVDDFKSKYESMTIDPPVDKYSKLVDDQWTLVKADINKFIKQSEANIAKFEKEIGNIEATLPFELMTMEDYKEAYPKDAIDPVNRPTFWPHTPEDQPDYVDPEKKAGGGH